MQVSVTQTDIEKVWRPLTDAEAAIVPGLSDSAWTRILARAPGIESDMVANPDPLVSPAVVMDVMVSMIVRVLKNPDGARIRSESIDDHTEAVTVDSALSTGELYVSATELAMLTPATVPVYGMYVMGLGG